MIEKKVEDVDVSTDVLGNEFKRFIDERDYRGARQFFQTLTREQRTYLETHPRYKIDVRAMQFSSM